MRRVLRAFDFARSFLHTHRDFCYGGRADGANLICLNFTGERDLARQNTDSICADLNLRAIKFRKAAG